MFDMHQEVVPLSVCCDRFWYQVEPVSVQNLSSSGIIFEAEMGTHLCVALTYKLGRRYSFEDMVDVWESVLYPQRQPLPFTVLVIGFRCGGQDDPPATGASAKAEGDEDGEAFAKGQGYLYAVCDARTGQGVIEAFTLVAEDAHSVGRVRFAGDAEGLWAYRLQAKMACYRVRTCAQSGRTR